jgi:hypothetical protein
MLTSGPKKSTVTAKGKEYNAVGIRTEIDSRNVIQHGTPEGIIEYDTAALGRYYFRGPLRKRKTRILLLIYDKSKFHGKKLLPISKGRRQKHLPPSRIL